MKNKLIIRNYKTNGIQCLLIKKIKFSLYKTSKSTK